MLLVGTQVLLSKPYTTSQIQSSSKLKYKNKVYGYHNRRLKNFSLEKNCSVDSERTKLWTIIQEWMMGFEYNENMKVKRKDKTT